MGGDAVSLADTVDELQQDPEHQARMLNLVAAHLLKAVLTNGSMSRAWQRRARDFLARVGPRGRESKAVAP